MTAIKTVGIIGTGVIGASWTALFLAKGLSVSATDPSPEAEQRLRDFIDKAWPAMEEIGIVTSDGSRAGLRFSGDTAAAIEGVDLVQENGPEKIDFKTELYRSLDQMLPSNVIIASSSSGLTMSAIQKGAARYPGRCVTAHPFNPPHLIPLVEIVAGEATTAETVEAAEAFYTGLGKKTIRLRKEVPGHVANRLQAALLREIVYLVDEGVVSVRDADTACSWGPGLRWGVMGPVMLNHLGGGAGGIEHFFEQFAGPMTDWWAVLGNPTLSPEVQRKMIDGAHEEVGERSFGDLSEERDRGLLALLKARRAG